MNLAFLTPHFWPWFDRAGRAVGQLAIALQDRGHRPTILSQRPVECWPEEIYYQGVPATRFLVPQKKWSAQRRHLKQLARWFDEHRDSLDVVCVSGLGPEAEVAIKTLGKDVPVVLRAERAGREGDCLSQLELRHARRIKRACMKAAAFVGTSPTSHAELLAAGYPRDRVVAIPNGVALRPPRTSEAHVAARHTLAEADHGLMVFGDQTEVALYVGRLDDRRRLKMLVLAWEQVVASHTRAKLWIVGNGPELGSLRRLIVRHNLSWSIHMPGVFDEPEILYDAADLFLQPSIDDDRSQAVLEAMAAGLPVVATATSTNRELLGQHDTLVLGRGATHATVKHWSTAIIHAFEAASDFKRADIASLDVDRTAESYERWFEELVGATKTRRTLSDG